MSRREAIFDYIIAYKREHQGNSPSQRQIMRAVGLRTTSAVKHHLEKLEDEGRIITTYASSEIEIPGARWVIEEER